MSFKSVCRKKRERYGRQWSFSDKINIKWLRPQGVIDGLITAGMSGLAA